MRHRRFVVGLFAGALAAAVGGVASAAPTGSPRQAPPPAPTPVMVHVDAGQTVAQLGDGALGAVIWNPNPHAGDTAVPQLLRRAGINSIAYESGPGVDLYDWRTNTLKADPGDGPSHRAGNLTASAALPYTESLVPRVSFDRFGRIARSIRAEPLAYVNYGTGTPEEAAGFVRYANRVRRYGVEYWEIGQNNFLNGATIPGLDLAVDGHPDKSARAFATNAVAYADAMKAADPSIKVGITLFASNALPWNDTVLGILAPHLDFVDLQSYPGYHLSDADVLQSPRALAARFDALRALIARHTERRLELLVGETNSSVEAGAQQVGFVNALFAPDQFLSLYEAGVSRAYWFAFEQGLYDTPADIGPPWTPNAASIFGYGDYGLLSSGQCDADTGWCQPPVHTPFPAYHAIAMTSRLTAPGTRLVATGADDPLVRVHAARRDAHHMSVMAINQDPASPRTIALDLSGVRRSRLVGVETFAAGDLAPHRAVRLLGPHATVALAPYSITTLTFATAGGTR